MIFLLCGTQLFNTQISRQFLLLGKTNHNRHFSPNLWAEVVFLSSGFAYYCHMNSFNCQKWAFDELSFALWVGQPLAIKIQEWIGHL